MSVLEEGIELYIPLDPVPSKNEYNSRSFQQNPDMTSLSKRTLLSISILLGMLFPSYSGNVEGFHDGDRVCFIGDSITAGGGYSSQILLFYITRFPGMRLESFNCGISGDVASGGVTRYGWDIATNKPTVAVVMFGMNDVGRLLYTEGRFGPEVEAQRRTAIDNCLSSLDQLAVLLAGNAARTIFLTPSIYDQTGNQKTPNCRGVNDALKACADGIRTLAHKHNSGFIDLNGPMDAINREGQKKAPEFTIVGGDRVHPRSVGSLVMAYLFLKAQGMTPTVAKMGVDAASGKILEQDRCRISQVSTTASGITFDCIEESLPFPIADAARPALDLIPFTNELNSEILRIPGLGEGDYEILIDGQVVAKASAAALRSGLNLALVKETPQYKQAEEVQRLIAARTAIESNLRMLVLVERRYLRDLPNRSPESDLQVLNLELKKLRNTPENSAKAQITFIEAHIKYQPKKEALIREASGLSSKACSAAKPASHSYLIRPLHAKDQVSTDQTRI